MRSAAGNLVLEIGILDSSCLCGVALLSTPITTAAPIAMPAMTAMDTRVHLA